MIDQQIARHARHPRRKSSVRRSIAPQSPVDPQEYVLREVFRLRAIPREPIANVEDAARMAAHKLFPGRSVALEALLDQLGILLQRLISLESWYGDMRDHPRSISRKPRAACLGLPYYGTKIAPQMFPRAPYPVAQSETERRVHPLSAP